MARKDAGLGLSQKEIAEAFNDPTWAERFPPLLTVEQVAELLQVPKNTVYAWSSSGEFRGCGRRMGKHLRFFRNRLLTKVFNEGFHANER